jgi:hypothetical protein
MAIVVLGSPQEAHAACIYQKIQARGKRAIYWDTRNFPAEMKISLSTGPERNSLGYFSDETGQPFALDEVEAVYWRTHLGFATPPVEDAHLQDMAYREIESTWGSLFRLLPCRWVNSPEAVGMHVFKHYQLTLMHRAGIRIPQTLVTNDADAVCDFYDRLNGQVIYKPVRGGAHTSRLTQEDLQPERLDNLAKSPVQFQELIEGVDIRAYLIKDQLFAAEIQSHTLDFRDDPGAPIVPIKLPAAAEQDCHQALQLLGLAYSGIDLRRTPQGEYVFLEANPCPMFIYFEQQTGYPISNCLVDLLMPI